MSGMQRQDYERISTSVRMVRRETLEALADEDPACAVVRRSYQDLAVQLARAMWAVNKRFRYEEFIRDCVGRHDATEAKARFRELTPDVQ